MFNTNTDNLYYKKKEYRAAIGSFGRAGLAAAKRDRAKTGLRMSAVNKRILLILSKIKTANSGKKNKVLSS